LSPVSPSKKDGNRTAPVSSQVETAENDQQEEAKKQMASLSNHIETTLKPKGKRDEEEESEESSRFSFGFQTTILQFDPTNPDNVTLVNQAEMKITSENIKNADGTESELHISDLAGLPTFEAPPATFHDSTSSGFNDALGPVSTTSLGTNYSKTDDEGQNEEISQNAGEKSEGDKQNEAKEGESKTRIGKTKSGRLRGVTGTKSFLYRMGREKPPESAEQAAEAQKTLFAGWGKKEKDENDPDDEPKSRFRRKKREPKAMIHQALEDDGSDHEN
jgi:hypothetical protein